MIGYISPYITLYNWTSFSDRLYVAVKIVKRWGIIFLLIISISVYTITNSYFINLLIYPIKNLPILLLSIKPVMIMLDTKVIIKAIHGSRYGPVISGREV